MQVKNFEDLEIWKGARALTRAIYQLTGDSRFAKGFGLRDQIRRAASQSCRTSLKDSNAVAIKSLFSFFTLPKHHAARFALNFT
jgi:hypothetical protein